jgi:RNA polymerase sigma-70 factor (ECF subfamily)
MLDLMTADFDFDLESIVPATKEELLGRVAQGDEAAFGELYDQMAPRVLGPVFVNLCETGLVGFSVVGR